MMNVICGTNQYALEDIIEKYNGMLYRLAIIRMQNKEDAEEVVQDTFVKLIEHIQKKKTFNDEEHLKAWLLTVATNRGKSILTLYWNKNTEGMDGLKEFAECFVKEIQFYLHFDYKFGETWYWRNYFYDNYKEQKMFHRKH